MSDIVDRAAHERIKAIKERMRGIDVEIARGLWEYGHLFLEVQAAELWRPDGAEDLYDWAQEKCGYSRTSVDKMMDIARNFSPDIAERCGVEKLYSALRYRAATSRHEKPGDLVAARLRIHGAKGRFTSIDFLDATYRQVDEATRIVLDGHKEKPEPAADADRIAAFEKALPPPPAGMKPKHRVVVKKAKDGQEAFTFHRIPRSGLRAFAEAILASLAEG
jgi:hypothetical protein